MEREIDYVEIRYADRDFVIWRASVGATLQDYYEILSNHAATESIDVTLVNTNLVDEPQMTGLPQAAVFNVLPKLFLTNSVFATVLCPRQLFPRVLLYFKGAPIESHETSCSDDSLANTRDHMR